MVIRRATPADAAAMAEVWLRSRTAALPTVRRAHSDNEVRAWFRDVVVPQRESWVAEDGGVIVGLLVLDGSWVSQLYVEPDRRGEAIGTSLLNRAKMQRPTGLELWTFQVNLPARLFYEKHGFVEVERTNGAANEEGEPDIRYQWASRQEPKNLVNRLRERDDDLRPGDDAPGQSRPAFLTIPHFRGRTWQNICIRILFGIVRICHCGAFFSDGVVQQFGLFAE